MSNDVYVLQKDLPDSKAGDEYVLRKYNEIMEDYFKNGDVDGSFWPRHYVENNPEWFKKKETPKPTVTNWTSSDEMENFNVIEFFIGKNYYPVSKERLAEILIAESKGDILIGKKKGVYSEKFIATDMIYTEKELLEAEEKAFNASRELQTFWHSSIDKKALQYQTFSDYKNNFKKRQ